MSDAGRSLSGRLREVGDAYLGVVRAELNAIASDLGASGRRLARALILIAVALGVAFWTLGLLLYFGVELLALALPRWGAVGAVLGLFVVICVLLAVAVRRRLAAIEAPNITVLRHLDDHRSWWRERVAGDEGEPPPARPEAP